ncbi:transcriptional regulator [Fusibacter bizertensis]|uniref:Transcriptional regulator n=1 Tax=Fusibacter bizertensis TaxID=1488331 RepID=A0ABT6NE14_9FIRM|nr:helix-turn-helix domain-containing protein [Fusibacter bizertensis]MDH8678650.1 transcriptional regulator [Fusibacter bizertensis]
MKNDKSTFYNANDIATILGISTSSAYRIIKELNHELHLKGFIVIRGKISKKYFEEKFYN